MAAPFACWPRCMPSKPWFPATENVGGHEQRLDLAYEHLDAVACCHRNSSKCLDPCAREDATACERVNSAKLIRFNPRAREGATRSRRCGRRWLSGFNPRAREGATWRSRRWPPAAQRFNPRAREGATFRRPARPRPTRCFNPRAREGATHGQDQHQRAADVSIHAPVRARPAVRKRDAVPGAVSIHAPVRARPPVETHSPRRGPVSIHAPVRARLSGRRGSGTTACGFNPRAREGATEARVRQRAAVRFQSTRP